ncbi:MAG: bifunctional riboflavin kinase/FAD synthetase [Clostridia bacterium]|nr:bifunctional riboflavin kinase/FAD synthetase [Clostridia bacterium]
MNRYVVALGMFDGVHLGHRVLLQRAALLAHADGDTAAAFTYANHPKELFCGDFRYLTDAAERAALMRAVGIDRVETVPFTKDFAAMSPEAFVDWLLARMDGRISTVVCGYDYRFGAGAKGDGALLTALGQSHGFGVEIIGPVQYGDAPCSSTRVRKALTDGNIADANAMLSRPYAITGPVVHNKAIGRTMGFPTANVDPGKRLLPKDGVYATALLHGGACYAAVTNIGTNPTVGGESVTLETFVPDETLDLYGKTVTVLFLERIRDEKRFASKDELAAEIAQNAESAKKVFKEAEKSVYKFARLW